MDDRILFASLLLATQLGILRKPELIETADQRIAELDKPEFWLIELSTKGSSEELEWLIVSMDEGVYLQVIRLVYRAWVKGTISNENFSAFCHALSEKVAYPDGYDKVLHASFFCIVMGEKVVCDREWYNRLSSTLSWILDEVNLYSWEDSVPRIRSAIEEILQS
jgi:hypothetical protein